VTRSILTALAVSLAVPATAQSICAPHDHMSDRLRQEYGETRQAVAYGSQQLITVWANLETETWTITMTTPDGKTCVMGAGHNYTPLAEPAGEVM
jgi:hypothetical protein